MATEDHVIGSTVSGQVGCLFKRLGCLFKRDFLWLRVPIYYDVSPATQINCIENLKIHYLSGLFRRCRCGRCKKKSAWQMSGTPKGLQLRCAGHNLGIPGGDALSTKTFFSLLQKKLYYDKFYPILVMEGLTQPRLRLTLVLILVESSHLFIFLVPLLIIINKLVFCNKKHI